VDKDNRNNRDESQPVDFRDKRPVSGDAPKGIQRQFPQALSLRGNMVVSPFVTRKRRGKSTQIYLISITSPRQIFKAAVLKTINTRSRTNFRGYSANKSYSNKRMSS